ncbi:TIGR01244 family phosphatase [Massilia sp. UMI-21]|nr:TIGR01244 family phosphatase [Massilia sp. UMI-21]
MKYCFTHKPGAIATMRWRSLASYLALACATLGAVPALSAAEPAPGVVQASEVAPGIAVAGQLREADLPLLKAQGYTRIISLRPDGEGPGQPSSAAMASAAQAQDLRFSYIPVRPGKIPDEAVEALRTALAGGSQRVLIYCRSGSRAARTWGLAEASRPGGRDATTILAAIRAAGQSADDLGEALSRRIAGRGDGIAQ